MNTSNSYSSLEVQQASFNQIQSLVNRWSKVKTLMDKGKNDKRDMIDKQIHQIEALFSFDHSKDQGNFNEAKEQIKKLGEQINNYKNDRKQICEKSQNQAEQLEDILRHELEIEKNQKRKVEIELLKQIEERFQNLNDLLAFNHTQYYEKFDSQVVSTISQVKDIRSILEKENQQRVESQEFLLTQMDLEINKFYQMMAAENKLREETNLKILEMVDHVQQSIKKEITLEAQARQESNSSILRMLESTCKKIDETLI